MATIRIQNIYFSNYPYGTPTPLTLVLNLCSICTYQFLFYCCHALHTNSSLLFPISLFCFSYCSFLKFSYWFEKSGRNECTYVLQMYLVSYSLKMKKIELATEGPGVPKVSLVPEVPGFSFQTLYFRFKSLQCLRQSHRGEAS